MSFLDTITGGNASKSRDDAQHAVDALKAIGVPSPQSLTLPELEKYVVAGVITPDQAQAFTVQKNALEGTSAKNQGLDEQLSALASLQDIIDQGGNDAQERADVGKVLGELGTSEHGANLAALDQAAQRGTANSGLTLAAMLANNQNAATNANQTGLDAAANAEARQLNAITGAGNLGTAVQGEEYNADLNKANAANAIQEFNAQQGQGNSQFNVGEANKAKAANVANAQSVANANTQTKQLQQESVPAAQQQAFEDALQRATGVAGAYENAGNVANTQGQQNAGFLGGIISAGGNAASAFAKPPAPTTNAPTPAMAHGGEVCMEGGGIVPGTPMIPNRDTTRNDTVPAMLSPHEVVIPATIAQRRDPAEVMSFLRSLPRPAQPSIHPKAIADTLKALHLIHTASARC